MYKSARLLSNSSVLLPLLFLLYSPALNAATPVDIQKMQENIAKQEAMVKAQQKALNEQKEKLAQQEKEIIEQRGKLDSLLNLVTSERKKDDEKTQLINLDNLATLSKQESKNAVGTGTSLVAPQKDKERPEINMLPDSGGVLTPQGVLMYENSLEYVNTTSNVFTFDGVKLAELVFVGVTYATTAKRQIVQDSSRFRLGLTKRLETDVRIPYVYRIDNTTQTDTNSNTSTNSTIKGDGLGDIDVGLAYQMNKGQEGWPFFVGNFRYKANNADGPFDVNYDANNIATALPTGTGFNSVEASMTAIKVTDPAVLFTNIGYVYNIGDTIDKNFGNTRVIEVDPGDAINFSTGMGFSVNEDLSFTFGYKHSYVFSTTQKSQKVSDGTMSKSESDDSSVGALMVGTSYHLSPIASINMNVEVGATNDAPDVRVGFRIPIRLGKLF